MLGLFLLFHADNDGVSRLFDLHTGPENLLYVLILLRYVLAEGFATFCSINLILEPVRLLLLHGPTPNIAGIDELFGVLAPLDRRCAGVVGALV